MKAGKIALYGLLLASAFVLGYLDSLIPLGTGIPGVKAGISNVVVLFALYRLGGRDAFFIALARIILTGFTFGNLTSIFYSLAGGLLSLLVMAALKKTGWLGVPGVSVCGGVFHNIGQLLAAALLLKTSAVFYYAPFLLIAGAAAGFLTGTAAALILKALSKKER